MDQNTSIEQAAAHFRALLTEQLNRQARMSQGSPAKDFSRMERIVIGLIPGDGIGPILMAQARRVLEKLLAAELAVGRVELRDIEGLTIENRTAQGKAIPDEVLASIKDCDVLLKGPTETPKGGTLESANVPCAGSWTCLPTCGLYPSRSWASTGPSSGRIRRANTLWAAGALRCPVC